MAERGVLLFGTYPPPYGGVSTHVRYLSRYLTQHDYKVYVVSHSNQSATEVEEVEDNVVIYRYKSTMRSIVRALMSEPKMFLSCVYRGLGIKESANLTYQKYLLNSIVRRHRDIGLISAYHCFPRGFVATCVGGEHGIPVSLTIFGEIYAHKEEYLKRRKLIESIVRQADVVLSVSRHCAASLNVLGIEASDVRVIPYGIDVNAFSMDVDGREIRKKFGVQDDENFVLFVGRLDENTGAGTVLDMLPLLLKGHDNIKVVMAGAKGELTQRAMKAAVQFEGRAFVMTDVPREELCKYYAACDVVLAPTTDERACMGLTIKEAMASGKPIIAADVGGVPEAVVDGITGYLVSPNSPEELAEMTMKVLSKPDTDGLSLRARKRAEELFDKNKTCERIMEIFEYLMNKDDGTYGKP